MTKKDKKFIREYVKKIWGMLTSIRGCPVCYYQIDWKEEKKNSAGGYMGIDYQPVNLDAVLFVYSDIFEGLPDEGITDGFLTHVRRNLCHEMGHVYIWNLEGTKRDIELAATKVGVILMQVLDSRLEEVKK